MADLPPVMPYSPTINDRKLNPAIKKWTEHLREEPERSRGRSYDFSRYAPTIPLLNGGLHTQQRANKRRKSFDRIAQLSPSSNTLSYRKSSVPNSTREHLTYENGVKVKALSNREGLHRDVLQDDPALLRDMVAKLLEYNSALKKIIMKGGDLLCSECKKNIKPENEHNTPQHDLQQEMSPKIRTEEQKRYNHMEQNQRGAMTTVGAHDTPSISSSRYSEMESTNVNKDYMRADDIENEVGRRNGWLHNKQDTHMEDHKYRKPKQGAFTMNSNMSCSSIQSSGLPYSSSAFESPRYNIEYGRLNNQPHYNRPGNSNIGHKQTDNEARIDTSPILKLHRPALPVLPNTSSPARPISPGEVTRSSKEFVGRMHYKGAKHDPTGTEGLSTTEFFRSQHDFPKVSTTRNDRRVENSRVSREATRSVSQSKRHLSRPAPEVQHLIEKYRSPSRGPSLARNDSRIRRNEEERSNETLTPGRVGVGSGDKSGVVIPSLKLSNVGVGDWLGGANTAGEFYTK